MININFFEKEKTNILPYIVGGIFFLLLLFNGPLLFHGTWTTELLY